MEANLLRYLIRHEGRPVSRKAMLEDVWGLREDTDTGPSMVAIWGLKQRSYWRRLGLIPLWDAVAVAIWAVSFLRSSIRWRGSDYYIRGGTLVPVNPGLGKGAV